MITIYKYIGILLIPLIKLNLLLRISNNKESKERYKERYGIASKTPFDKSVIWIHASSVGEFKSADIIINSLYKKYSILVTTTTLSAGNYATENYSDKIIHQFAPLDVIFWVEKFLKYWNPRMVIWIESDLWPITLSLIKKKNIQSILLNVRISPKSFNKWKLLKYLYKKMTDSFSEIFAQSENDQKRIACLTKRKINFIGNLKLASINKNTEADFNEIISLEKKSFSIMLASTHLNEEAQILPSIKKLLLDFKDLKIIIAPRHPERADTILAECKKNNLSATIANENRLLKNQIKIINTFGNLEKYFFKTDIVFLGGSLINKGGHNPIEPAINNCAIITGPNIYNWQNIYDDMIKNNACIKCDNISELEKNIRKLLYDDRLMKNMKDNARNIAKKKFFDQKKLFEIIEEKIGSLSC